MVSGGSGGTIQVRTGSATGTVLGTVAVPNTGSWTTFADVTTTCPACRPAPQNVYLTFTGSGTGLFDVDDFTLVRGTAAAGTGPVKGLAGKCLDVRNGATADGTQIQSTPATGAGARPGR